MNRLAPRLLESDRGLQLPTHLSPESVMTATATADPLPSSTAPRPAIDLLIPPRIETATFALG